MITSRRYGPPRVAEQDDDAAGRSPPAAAEVQPASVQKRYRVRVPLRHFEARTTGPLTCCLAQQDLQQGPTDSPAFTPLTPAALDVPDLDLPGKRGRVISKGGTTDWVHWQTGTAILLPRLLAGRREGPVFLTARKPGRAVASGDLCPVTRRARLSYRRAAESFKRATRPVANPGARHEELEEEVHGWTLHQLRHSLLSHQFPRTAPARVIRPSVLVKWLK